MNSEFLRPRVTQDLYVRLTRRALLCSKNYLLESGVDADVGIVRIFPDWEFCRFISTVISEDVDSDYSKMVRNIGKIGRTCQITSVESGESVCRIYGFVKYSPSDDVQWIVDGKADDPK